MSLAFCPSVWIFSVNDKWRAFRTVIFLPEGFSFGREHTEGKVTQWPFHWCPSYSLVLQGREIQEFLSYGWQLQPPYLVQIWKVVGSYCLSLSGLTSQMFHSIGCSVVCACLLLIGQYPIILPCVVLWYASLSFSWHKGILVTDFWSFFLLSRRSVRNLSDTKAQQDAQRAIADALKARK